MGTVEIVYAKGETFLPRGELKGKREGLRYETCADCGDEWNVSVWAKEELYRCPRCRAKIKRGAGVK